MLTLSGPLQFLQTPNFHFFFPEWRAQILLNPQVTAKVGPVPPWVDPVHLHRLP